MVSKTKPFKHHYSKMNKLAYFDLLDVESVTPTVQNLLEGQNILPELKEELEGYLTQFLLRVINDISHLKSVDSLKEYYEACKRRYNDLSRICAILLTADDGELIVHRKDAQGNLKQYIFGSVNKGITVSIGDSQFELGTKRPRSYGALFRGLAELTYAISELYRCGEFDAKEYHDSLKSISIVITTLGKVYEDIRGGHQFKKQEYQDSIARVNQTHQLDKSSKYWLLFQQFQRDLEEGKSNYLNCKRYIKDIVRAIPKALPAYTDNDLYISFKSTGTSYRGNRIPGLYASIVETDTTNINDDLIGYNSTYNKSINMDAVQYDRKTILIPQHKLPYRMIHMASNPIQDRANYYHNRLMDVLRQIPTDCTLNQTKGVSFARKVTSPSFRIKSKNNIYCLDISKATDTLNKEFQEDCISLLFGKEHAENWTKLVTGSHNLVEGDVILHVFTPVCGQPQGYLSSFPAFAWVHHVIMRLVMLEHGLTDIDPSMFYRVLGDDSIISWPDPDGSILESYIQCCDFINWKTHPSKGYTYRYNSDDTPFAEFAKVRILDGKVATPIPIRMLLKSTKSPSDLLSYYWWLSVYDTPQDIEDVYFKLRKHFPNTIRDEHYELMLMYNHLDLPVYKDFTSNNETLWEDDLLTIGLASYFYNKLKSTILDQFLPDHLIGTDRKPNFSLDTKEERDLINLIENMDHKYIKVWEKNETLINVIKSLFDDIPSIGISAWSLTDIERDHIYSACEYLLLLTDWKTIPPHKEFKSSIEKALEVLTRLNPRSVNKTSRVEVSLLEKSIETMFSILDSLSSENDEEGA